MIYPDAGCSINKDGEKRFHEYIKLLNSSDSEMIDELENVTVKWSRVTVEINNVKLNYN